MLRAGAGCGDDHPPEAQRRRDRGRDEHAGARVRSALPSPSCELEEVPLPIDRDALIAAYFAQVAVGTAISIESTASWVGRAPTPRDFEPGTWLLGTI